MKRCSKMDVWVKKYWFRPKLLNELHNPRVLTRSAIYKTTRKENKQQNKQNKKHC